MCERPARSPGLLYWLARTDRMSNGDRATGGGLAPAERERLAAFRRAERLADLVALTEADSERDAYVAAKEEWTTLWRRLDRDRDHDAAVALPGERVTVNGVTFHVHGVTHTGTDAERSYLRKRVDRLLTSGGTVYAEQGLRPLHFEAMDVCAMDDYRWALDRRVAGERGVGAVPTPDDRIASATERVRRYAYRLVAAGGAVYGERVERALGSAVSGLLTGHAARATGDGYEAFALRRQVAIDPTRLPALQAYYRRTLLPQPVERAWVRRHDEDLEWVTHARNARMADYAVHHHDSGPVHVVVGAAHGPGVAYYLRRHRDGERTVGRFHLA